MPFATFLLHDHFVKTSYPINTHLIFLFVFVFLLLFLLQRRTRYWWWHLNTMVGRTWVGYCLPFERKARLKIYGSMTCATFLSIHLIAMRIWAYSTFFYTIKWTLVRSSSRLQAGFFSLWQNTRLQIFCSVIAGVIFFRMFGCNARLDIFHSIRYA